MTTPSIDQDDLLLKLKRWLREKQSNYVEHSSWNGDTEGGFYDLDEFNFDKLCDEIDAFSADLKGQERKWFQCGRATISAPQEKAFEYWWRAGHMAMTPVQYNHAFYIWKAAKAACMPSATVKLTDEQIMNAACTAADALDATRVSEMVPGGWKATTIFEGDTGLLRFGRLIEKAINGK